MGQLRVAAALLLIWCATTTRGATPSNRREGWETVWDTECDTLCGTGTRVLKVYCMEDFTPVEDSKCPAEVRPADTETCEVECRYVDPVDGDDSAEEGGRDQSKPLKTLAKCVGFAEDRSGDKTTSASDVVSAAPVTRCLLAAGVYGSGFAPGTVTNEKDNVVIQPHPSAPEGSVIFDGTSILSNLIGAWKEHPTLPDVSLLQGLSGLHEDAKRRPAVIVGGHNIMCAKETAIVDGKHPAKRGWATKSVPCFMWDPIKNWATVFSEEDARVSSVHDDAIQFSENVGLSLPVLVCAGLLRERRTIAARDQGVA